MTDSNSSNPVKSALQRLMRDKPSKPGEIYGVPGSGDSTVTSVIVIVLLLLFWWYITYAGWIKPLFLPSPQDIVANFLEILKNGFTGSTIWEHVAISTVRVFGAFALACAVGIPLGIAMGMSSVARGVFDPPIEFYRPIPPLAYLPLMIIWFGIDETSKILLIFLSTLAPIALGARAGVKSASIEQIHAAYSFGATRWQVIRRVILPSALPEIITAMRIGIGFGWTTLVAAEMVASTSGLGYMVLSASKFLQTGIVIMGIMLIAAIAYAFDQIMRTVERKVVPWKGLV